MDKLIEEVMSYNKYPHHEIPWEGWEFIPKTQDDIDFLADLVEWKYDAEFAALQVKEDGYVACVNLHVWYIDKAHFTHILRQLKEKGSN